MGFRRGVTMIGAGFDGEGGRGHGVILACRLLAGESVGGALGPVLVVGNLELVEEEFEERLLAGGILGGNVVDFLLQALEVGGGDLERVELKGGALGVDGVVVEGAHDLEEGELQAHRPRPSGPRGRSAWRGRLRGRHSTCASGGPGRNRAVHSSWCAGSGERGWR
jgi:hypothetical protein